MILYFYFYQNTNSVLVCIELKFFLIAHATLVIKPRVFITKIIKL